MAIQENETPKRVVIKLGTNLVTNKDDRIIHTLLSKIVEQVAALHEQGIMSVLVSSGSVFAGKEVMGELNQVTDKFISRQVYSAVGQPRMMRHFYSIFQIFGIRCAQVLTTKRDFSHGKHRKNMVNCYEGLLSQGIIPIANEDDAVSLSMSAFTDNDELAALVAELIQADKLIILSHMDGLYDRPPHEEGSLMIRHITSDQHVDHYIEEPPFDEENIDLNRPGGMKSKMKVAKETAKKGIPTIIANGSLENVILDIVEGKEVGTLVTKGPKPTAD
ncbi:glutamate 5-kinase [Echinicola jeungdonensis]|uniref:Glutamate 5-kinase n=1 Tax=Echinicola jeungdonensis TaxID=709343 RepID=A0ABV5J4X7_9BACT|nr:glutamate 5-kinase [Echinicola jeungdonensis]MDN3670584.1 glutamate 5-kinase [Echinicola jeungdonensis]